MFHKSMFKKMKNTNTNYQSAAILDSLTKSKALSTVNFLLDGIQIFDRKDAVNVLLNSWGNTDLLKEAHQMVFEYWDMSPAVTTDIYESKLRSIRADYES